MKLISFVIPVYNGSAMVERLHQHLLPVARSFGKYEMIFVDDGGPDGSFSILTKLQSKDPNVCAVELAGNSGSIMRRSLDSHARTAK